MLCNATVAANLDLQTGVLPKQKPVNLKYTQCWTVFPAYTNGVLGETRLTHLKRALILLVRERK